MKQGQLARKLPLNWRLGSVDHCTYFCYCLKTDNHSLWCINRVCVWWFLCFLLAALIDFFDTLTWRRTNWYQNAAVDSSWTTWIWLVLTICGGWVHAVAASLLSYIFDSWTLSVVKLHICWYVEYRIIHLLSLTEWLSVCYFTVFIVADNSEGGVIWFWRSSWESHHDFERCFYKSGS